MAVFAGNGSAASPSFTFSSDTNIGMYRKDADKLGFSVNGTERLYLDGATSSTVVGNALGVGVVPSLPLEVIGGGVGAIASIKSTNSGNGQSAELRIIGGNSDSTGLTLGQGGSGNTTDTSAYINAARTNSDLSLRLNGTTALSFAGNTASNNFLRATFASDTTFGVRNATQGGEFRVYIAPFGQVNNTTTQVLDLNPLDAQGRYIWLFAGKHNNQSVCINQGISFTTGNFGSGSWVGLNTIYNGNAFTSLSTAESGGIIQATWTGSSAVASGDNFAICLILGKGTVYKGLSSANGTVS